MSIESNASSSTLKFFSNLPIIYFMLSIMYLKMIANWFSHFLVSVLKLKIISKGRFSLFFCPNLFYDLGGRAQVGGLLRERVQLWPRQAGSREFIIRDLGPLRRDLVTGLRALLFRICVYFAIIFLSFICKPWKWRAVFVEQIPQYCCIPLSEYLFRSLTRTGCHNFLRLLPTILLI